MWPVTSQLRASQSRRWRSEHRSVHHLKAATGGTVATLTTTLSTGCLEELKLALNDMYVCTMPGNADVFIWTINVDVMSGERHGC